MARPRYRRKILEIPSLKQGNKKNSKSGVWCGRTSACMIYNYYLALESDSPAFIINNESDDTKPHDLIFPSGKVALNYGLAGFVRSAFPPGEDWELQDQHPDGKGEFTATGAPVGKEGRPREESEEWALEVLLNGRRVNPQGEARNPIGGILKSLDNNNPVLIYSGIASDLTWPRHIMVISGYEVDANGSLWLLFDDPGGQSVWSGHGKALLKDVGGDKDAADYRPIPVSKKHVQSPDFHGRRFWFRARRFFGQNNRSKPRDDRYCDYYDHDRKIIHRARAVINVKRTASAKHSWSESWLGVPYRTDKETLGTPIDDFWQRAEAGKTLYPLGADRTWHSGVHVGFRAGSIDAYCFGPGIVLLARQQKPDTDSANEPTPGTSFVLVRHFFDPNTLDVIDPHRARQLGVEQKGLKVFYSLYMHLLDPLAGDFSGDWAKQLLRKPAKVEREKWVDEHQPCVVVIDVLTPSGREPRMFNSLGTRAPKRVSKDDLIEYKKPPVGGLFYVPIDPEDTNAGPWSRPQASALPRRELAFYNPRATTGGELIKTKKKTPRTTHAMAETGTTRPWVLAKEPDGSAWVVVTMDPDFEPGIETEGLALTPPKGKDSVGPGDLFSVEESSVTLYLRTRRVKNYWFLSKRVKSDAVSLTKGLEFKAIRVQAAPTKKKRIKASIWPELVPCALVSQDELSSMEEAFSGQTEKAEVSGRLARGETMLFAVRIGRKDWSLNEAEGTVAPRTREKARMYAALTATGKFVGPRVKAQDATPATTCYLLDVPDDVRFPVVSTYKTGKVRAALIEVRLAVSKLKNNDDAVKHYEEDAKRHETAANRISKAVESGDVVRFDDFEPPIVIGRERVGRMGYAADGVRAFHFEIFAGEHILQKDGWKQRWTVIDDIPGDDVLSSDFIRKVADKIIEAKVCRSGHFGREMLESRRTGVLTRDDWEAFHNFRTDVTKAMAHARGLANFVCRYPSPWAVDWEDQLRQYARTRHGRQAWFMRALRIWKGDLDLEGIEGDPYFYHPVRFVEWLTTGLNVRVVNLPDKAPETVTLALHDAGGRVREIELSAFPTKPKDFSARAHRYRTITGAIRTRLTGKIVLPGSVETMNRELPVRIRSGVVEEIWVVHPEVQINLLPDSSGLIKYCVPVAHQWRYGQRAGADVQPKSFLLPVDPDNPLHFPDHGYSNVTVEVSTRFNLEMPEKITLELSDGFEFSSWQLRGAQWKDSSAPANTRSELPNRVTIEPKPKKQLEPFFTTYGTVSLVVTLRCLKWGLSGTLKIEVSGGDLTEPKSDTLEIASRGQIKARHKGEDVAKLQLYLAQILWRMKGTDSDLEGPCFRFSGKKKLHLNKKTQQWQTEPSKGPTKWVLLERSPSVRKSVKVTGRYDNAGTESPPPLASALWRFISLFGGEEDFELEVHHTDAKGGDSQPLTFDADHRAASTGFALERVFEATSEGVDARCPIVDQALYDEIVKRFEPPYAALHFPLAIEALNVPDGAADEVVKPRTYMLPGIDDEIRLKFEGFSGDTELILRLGEDGAYYFPADDDWDDTLEIETTAGRLSQGIKLRCFDAPNTDRKQNIVTVELCHEEIAELELGGVRPLLNKGQPGLGRDAMMLQKWLAKIDAKDGEKCFQGTADGRWWRKKPPKKKRSPERSQGHQALALAQAVLEEKSGEDLDDYADLVAAVKAAADG